MARAQAWKPSVDGRRILVTGAAGFIGSRLVDRLVGAGAVVAGLSRSASAPDSRAAFESFVCDITDPLAVNHVIGDFAPELLFHFAARPDGPENREHAAAAVEVNVVGTLNLLDAFAANDGRMFLFGDSTKVYGNAAVPYRESLPPAPTSSYAIAKSAAWEMCQLYERLHGIKVTSLRPTMIYGPGQGNNIIRFVIQCILDGRAQIPLMGGAQTRDPLFIEDALDAFVAAATVGPRISGRVVSLGGGAEVSVLELAERVIRVMGSDAEIVPQSQNVRPTEIWRSYCDNQEAKKHLGWQPQTTLDKGIERTVEAMALSSTRRGVRRATAPDRASFARP